MQTRSEEELRRLIAGVKREIARLGDMRPGHLSVQYRRSGGREIGRRPTSVLTGRSPAERIRKEEDDA